MITRSEKNKKLEKKLRKQESKEKQNKIAKFIIKTLLIIFIVFTLLALYMRYIGATGLEVREYKVESENLPDSFHGFKVVHFTDLHYLTTFKEKETNNLVNKINELKPDIVVFTGDLIDRRKTATEDDLNKLTKALNKIEATTGLYAVKGNHDYINDNFEKVFNETNFKIIDNSYELVYYKGNTPIMLTGTGSILKNDSNIDQAFSYDKEDNLYTISLLHEPDVIDDIISKYNVNLALSGHSHNGQIRLPKIGAIMKVDYGKNYPNEKYIINNTKLYVSGGLGTSKYEFRLFNKPSINLYRLTKEAK